MEYKEKASGKNTKARQSSRPKTPPGTVYRSAYSPGNYSQWNVNDQEKLDRQTTLRVASTPKNTSEGGRYAADQGPKNGPHDCQKPQIRGCLPVTRRFRWCDVFCHLISSFRELPIW